MSKLIDKLQRLGQDAPTPFGFGAATSRGSAEPPIMLIGRIAQDDLAKTSGLSETPADAILVSLKPGNKKLPKAIADLLKDHLWGASGTDIGQDQIKQLKDIGCDFLVFNADNTPAALLNDEDLGKVISVGPDLEENVAQAIQELPIDAAFFSPTDDLLPLTVKKLIDIELVRLLVDKAFVMVAPPNLSSSDLEVLRNAGIGGLVFELNAPDVIAKTKKALASVPRRRPRPTSKDVVFARPHSAGELAEVPGDDDDGDGDGVDF